MILGINTCTQKIEICIVEELSKKSIYYESKEHQKNDSEFILESLNLFLKDFGKSIFDIKKIVCVKGPGSFTAVRIGVIIANTIQSQTNCELFEVDTLQYLNYFCSEDKKLILSAGGKEFYTYENQNINLVNFNDIQNENFEGEISKKQLEKLNIKFNFVGINYSLKDYLVDFTKEKFILKKVDSIEPNYVKEANIDLSGLKKNLEKKSLNKSKEGYFMVLMSFILCFLMTPLIISLYETEVGQIQTYASKKGFMEQKLIKKNLANQIYDNKDWHGKNLNTKLTLSENFNQNIVNKTVQTLISDNLLENFVDCENFALLNANECDVFLNYAYTVPLLNHGYLNEQCSKFDFSNDLNSINSDCSFNRLQISESNFIPLFAEDQIIPENKEIFLRLKQMNLNPDYNLLAINQNDISKVILELNIIQDENIYAPNFTFDNLNEGRQNNLNFELTASKLASSFLFNYIDLNEDIFKINLQSLDFRDIKNIENTFNWENLENAYLKINFPNSIFLDSQENLIKNLDYQLLTNFKIGLDKTIIFNTIEKDGSTYYDSYVHIPVRLNERQGIVIDN